MKISVTNSFKIDTLWHFLNECRAFLIIMDPDWFISFQEKLDKHYAWPSVYIFKFIVPSSKEVQLRGLFPLHTTVTEKSSGKGRYVSLTYEMMMPSSQSVIEVYKKASVIEGIVAL